MEYLNTKYVLKHKSLTPINNFRTSICEYSRKKIRLHNFISVANSSIDID